MDGIGFFLLLVTVLGIIYTFNYWVRLRSGKEHTSVSESLFSMFGVGPKK